MGCKWIEFQQFCLFSLEGWMVPGLRALNVRAVCVNAHHILFVTNFTFDMTDALRCNIKRLHFHILVNCIGCLLIYINVKWCWNCTVYACLHVIKRAPNFITLWHNNYNKSRCSVVPYSIFFIVSSVLKNGSIF